mgnify:CR=1 FL=1
MDKLIKGLICNGHARVYLAYTTELVEEARIRHDLWPTAAAALGRTLSIAAVMGGMLKTKEEKISIIINGGGELGTILVDAYPDGGVRGFVANPHVMLVNEETKKLDVGKAVGTDGYLRVIRDTSLKDDFTGTTALQSGEIGEDFAYYFTVSEQVPTAISVGVLVNDDMRVNSAGVFMLQMMPNATEEDILMCEDIITGLKPISTLVSEVDTPEELLEEIFGEEIEILETEELEFRCDCSKERMAEALTTLKEEDLEDMIREDKGCEIVCRYCNNKYTFNEEELNQILIHKRKQS